MGLAPLPQPPIKYKVNKPSMPKPKSIFKTKESKKPAYPGEASKKEDEGEEKGGFFLTQTEDEGEKEYRLGKRGAEGETESESEDEDS